MFRRSEIKTIKAHNDTHLNVTPILQIKKRKKQNKKQKKTSICKNSLNQQDQHDQQICHVA